MKFYYKLDAIVCDTNVQIWHSMTYLLKTRAIIKNITTRVSTHKQTIIAVIETLWLSEPLLSSPRGVTVTLCVVVALQDLSLHTYNVANWRSSVVVNWLLSISSLIFPAINPFTVISKYALLPPAHWKFSKVIETLQSQSSKMFCFRASNNRVLNLSV